VLRVRGRELPLVEGAPLLMGVVNASPESFSDGGLYAGLDAQVARALDLVAAGAHLIDVGGESGVTDRGPLPAEVREHLAAIGADLARMYGTDPVLRA